MAGEKILIVDDEEDVCALLARILKPHGFEIRTADGPDAALQTLEEFKPDLLITDIRMPGMDGVELARFVKELSPHTGIIIMTAYATADTAIDSLRLGADDYLKKPIKLDELAGAVRSALEKRHGKTDKQGIVTERGSESPDRDKARRDGISHGASQFRTATAPHAGPPRPDVQPPRPETIHLAAATQTARERSSPSTISIRTFPFLIGREHFGSEGPTEAGLDLVIRDEPPFQVSRSHCAIERRADGCCARDLNSRLGTIVNGEPIGAHMPAVMADLKPGRNTVVLGNDRSPYVFSVFLKKS
ncbi:MAG: response regulator [Planctomycetota bacterium]